MKSSSLSLQQQSNKRRCDVHRDVGSTSGKKSSRSTRERSQQQHRAYQKNRQKEREREREQKYNEKMMDRTDSAHEYAQKLNNLAAMCIEINKHDKAIESLGKSLRLSEMHATDQSLDRSNNCTCRDCSLDGCIVHSETDSNLVEMFDISCKINSRNNKKNRRQSDDDDAMIPPPTLYRKPIRIPKRTIREGHNMGSTLFLIITFNLALAHHLKVVDMMKKTKTDSSSTQNLLNSTVQLYELVNNWQYQERSVRFQSILYTNLSHLNSLFDARSMKSLKRRLNELISTVTPPSSILDCGTCDDYTTNDDERSNDDRRMKNRSPKSSATIVRRKEYTDYSSSRSVVSCDLEFEYYTEKEKDEFYADQEEFLRIRRKCDNSKTTTSSSTFRKNDRWEEAISETAKEQQDVLACAAMRNSRSYERLQTEHRFADVA